MPLILPTARQIGARPSLFTKGPSAINYRDTISKPVISGGGGYVAKAVTFADNTVHIDIAALNTINTPYLAISYWINAQTGANPGVWSAVGMIDFNKDADQDSYTQLRSAGDGRVETQNAVTADAEGVSYFGYGNHNQDPLINTLLDSVWTNIKISAQCDHPAGEKIAQIYYNDTAVTLEPNDDDADTFDILFSGVPLRIRFNSSNQSDPPIPVASAADLWITNEKVDWSIEANRRKVQTAGGKPVYLGASGELVTGTAAGVFCSGDATDFWVNQGTWGDAVLTGALTNATSPSD